MSSTVIVIAGVAIIAYTIGSQLLGTLLRAKRLVILPAILTLVGVVNLAGSSVHPNGTDIALIAVGSAIAACTGLSLGVMMRLEERGGWLWGKLPKSGLWLWAVFFASRGALIAVAHATGAHVAGGTHAELLVLGINRLGQALVIGARAMSSGIPFAPESDGSRPLGGLFGAPSTPGAVAQRPVASERPVQREPSPDVETPPADPPSAGPPIPSLRSGARLTDMLRGSGGGVDPYAQGPRSRRAARRARRGR